MIEHESGLQYSSSYMCHVCNKIYSTGATLTRHLKFQHNIQWQSGYSRFRYKLDSDGYYRLQTVRYDSVELVEKLNRQQQGEANKNLVQDTDVYNILPQSQSLVKSAEDPNNGVVNLAFGQLINVIEQEFAVSIEPKTSMNINSSDTFASTSTVNNLNYKLEDNHNSDSLDLENILNSSFNFINNHKQLNNQNSSFEAMQF